MTASECSSCHATDGRPHTEYCQRAAFESHTVTIGARATMHHRGLCKPDVCGWEPTGTTTGAWAAATEEDPMTPYERDARIEALRRRGLTWQLGSDLTVANDPALLAKVEVLPDRELAALNRLDASWRTTQTATEETP